MYDAPMIPVAVLGVTVAKDGTLPVTGTSAVILTGVGFVLLISGFVLVALREVTVRRHRRAES